ncbi:7-cyano-7-deazaguanine synthase QueC [Polynucleobacter paneuropaeus]|nr:7-cyano-7-deazaguanine synthase QueC [Polynucleobacter paneuropaeus]
MNASISALVLFSGGQDSTTCLAWALDKFSHVETVAFNYNQRHVVELECRKVVLQNIRTQFPEWADKLGEDHLLDIPVLGSISDTALTQDREIEFSKSGLPTTFVPGRNLLFLTLASAIAYRRGIEVLVGGMCETDFSGYPDCRDETIKSQEKTLSLGLDYPLIIETPLMWIDKAATWKMANDIGGNRLINIIKNDTHTCYLGDRSVSHDWGFGCGTCPACELRKAGWNKFNN